MVTISPAGPDRVRIDGWVAPGGGVQVELRLTGETRVESRPTATAGSSSTTCRAAWPSSSCARPRRATQPPVITPSIEL